MQNKKRYKKAVEIIEAGIDPKEDIMFKMLFSRKGNEELLKDFLEKLLNIKIMKLEIANEVSLDVGDIQEKLGRIDIKTIINDIMIIDLEMQVKEDKYISERMTFYGSKLVSEQLKKTESYDKLKEVIVVSILDKTVFKEELNYIHESITVLKGNRKKEVNKILKYMYIELDKFRKKKIEEYDELDMWLAFLDAKNNKEGAKMAVMKNEKIEQAVLICNELQGDEKAKRITELNDKWRRDYMSERYQEGLIDGEARGIKKGEAQGIKKGEARGKRIEKLKVLNKLLDSGIDIKEISKILEMPISEIKKINFKSRQ